MLEITLGRGTFGIVKEGLLTTGNGDPEVVAVKMLKGNTLSLNWILSRFQFMLANLLVSS